MEAETFLDTARTTTTLLGIGPGDKGVDESRELSSFVKPHLAVLSSVNDTRHVRDGDTGFGDVGCQHNLSDARRRDKEGCLLILSSDGRVKGIHKPLLSERSV